MNKKQVEWRRMVAGVKGVRFAMLWSAVLLAFLMPACSGDHSNETNYAEAIESTRAYILDRMAEESVAGFAVALVDGDRIVWAEGFGAADRGEGRKVDPDTVFEIGSVSKTMTAALIMRLVADGTLELDRPLTDYLPRFSMQPCFAGDAAITVRMLLTHHAGVPGDILTNTMATQPMPDFADWLLDYLAGYYPSYPTNTFWAYSNSGLVLAGEAAAVAAGRTLVQLGDALLADFQMRDSAFSRPEYLQERLAKSYYLDEELPYFENNVQAAGGVISTIRDMARYAGALLVNDGRVLHPDRADGMFIPQNTDVPLDLGKDFGLTWFLSDPLLGYTGRVARHAGATLGHVSYLALLLDQGLAAVALSNSAQAGELVDEAVHRLLIAAVEAKTGVKPPPPTIQTSEPTPLSLEMAEAWAGTYVVVEQGVDRVRAQGDSLQIFPAGGQEWLPLVHRENGWFTVGDDLSAFYEFATIANRDLIVVHEVGEHRIRGRKYDPPPIPQPWLDRIGAWQVVDLPPTDASNYVPDELALVSFAVEIYLDDDVLMIDIGDGLQVIDPATEDLGFFHGFGRIAGSAIIAENAGRNERLTFLGVYYEKAMD